ncbi:hypothetical protein EUTSA_v10001140mg [Eutrema salsugineum]|uniref:Uncharacterized protein n=1 Tax=Eutrema salsugineum TaxID=72664 RepID=V4N2X1_EUTSA|nr:hypothetical protein EUTSA_v10001140mg [Eutrema salsugineum]
MENMDEDVSKHFIEFYQTNFRKDPELLLLLKTSKKVSELCERERRITYGESLNSSFRKTMQDLRNFTALYDKHQRDYKCDDQDLGNMMVKLETTMKEIDKKLRRVRGTRVIVAGALLAPVIVVVSLSKVVAGIFGFVPMMVALKEVERISVLVARLEAVERSIRVTVELAVKKYLSSTLVDLDRETGRCDGVVQFGCSLAREKIFEFLIHGEKKSE